MPAVTTTTQSAGSFACSLLCIHLRNKRAVGHRMAPAWSMGETSPGCSAGGCSAGASLGCFCFFRAQFTSQVKEGAAEIWWDSYVSVVTSQGCRRFLLHWNLQMCVHIGCEAARISYPNNNTENVHILSKKHWGNALFNTLPHDGV